MKLFKFRLFRVSDDEKEASISALMAAEEVARVARKIQTDSADVGTSLRNLRNENHFGRSLTHAFRPEPRGH